MYLRIKATCQDNSYHNDTSVMSCQVKLFASFSVYSEAPICRKFVVSFIGRGMAIAENML